MSGFFSLSIGRLAQDRMHQVSILNYGSGNINNLKLIERNYLAVRCQQLHTVLCPIVTMSDQDWRRWTRSWRKHHRLSSAATFSPSSLPSSTSCIHSISTHNHHAVLPCFLPCYSESLALDRALFPTPRRSAQAWSSVLEADC